MTKIFYGIFYKLEIVCFLLALILDNLSSASSLQENEVIFEVNSHGYVLQDCSFRYSQSTNENSRGVFLNREDFEEYLKLSRGKCLKELQKLIF